MNYDYVVYTAITNGYDNLKKPKFKDPNATYICYTDSLQGMKANGWELRLIPNSDLDVVKKARRIKLLPHELFPEFEYSIWVDGNIEITKNMNDLIDKYMINKDAKFVTFKHPFRECIYEEAKTCIEEKRDKAEVVIPQIERYKAENFPINYGLVESNVILRDHNDSSVMQISNDWWNELNNNSRRDQLSFNYIVWKNSFKYHYFQGNTRKGNEYFKLKRHKITLKEIFIKILRKLSLQ